MDSNSKHAFKMQSSGRHPLKLEAEGRHEELPGDVSGHEAEAGVGVVDEDLDVVAHGRLIRPIFAASLLRRLR